ncbi:MAG TPA: hypothetical protein VNA30_02010, partial [Mycobacteriales bacterium]|nr:hypothetical protein [Mycobacteriales bacterium]
MLIADRLLHQAHRAHGLVAALRWKVGAGDLRTATWPEAAAKSSLRRPVAHCPICGWRGKGFQGVEHSESALCPACGSISRDRFLYWCWVRRTPYNPKAVVLETSPRLDQVYRDRMASRVHYLSSDYDESAH